MPDENYRNPLREAKHQLEVLKDYFNHIGALAGQEDRIRDVSTKNPGGRSWHLSVLFRATQRIFYSKNFYQCCLNENYRNTLREAKHQLELLKDYFNHIGALAGQGYRI